MSSAKQLSSRAGPKSSSKFATSSATTKQLNRSSLLKHAFAPSHFQLNLFASVVQGLDAQVLRLHDTLTGNLRVEHSLGDGKVSCLDWGHYGAASGDQRPAKKRKTKEGAESLQEVGSPVIVVGALNSPEIEVFSPAQGDVIAVLGGGTHTQGIRDFRFIRHTSEHRAWSLGGDGKLVEWNMEDGSSIRSIQLPSKLEHSNRLLALPSAVLCAQSTIYGLNPEQPAEFATLQGFSSNVHSMSAQARGDQTQLTSVIGAADSERHILVFDYAQQRIKGRLLTTNAVQNFKTVEKSHSLADSQMLAAVTEGGTVELFENPFDFSEAESQQSTSAKASKRAMSRQPVAIIKFNRPGKPSDVVPITSVDIDGDDLVLSWVEGAAHPCFERITWRSNDGGMALAGEVSIEKSKSQNVTTNARMNGLDTARTHVDDSHAVVFNGGEAIGQDEMEVDKAEVIDISSAAEEEESSSDEEKSPPTNGVAPGAARNAATFLAATRSTMVDDESDDDEDEQPSFGELLKAMEPPEAIDVPSALPAKAQAALVPQGGKTMARPAGVSLKHVLTQSLQTNDRELLETCFHERDTQMVKATIEDLDSGLAASLLERLTERLHNRPGRAGSLMIWIRWTLVAHGGHLGSQPQSIKQIRQLYGVVKERAQALPALLMLKGKLDMLDSQMQVRQQMMERSRQIQEAQEDEEDGAIYVEGEVEVDSDDEMEVSTGKANAEGEDIEFDSDEEDVIVPADTRDSDEEESEDEDANDLIDDEAEEADEDSEMSGDEIDHDDMDSLEDDEESESELDEPSKKAKSKAKVNGIVRRK